MARMRRANPRKDKESQANPSRGHGVQQTDATVLEDQMSPPSSKKSLSADEIKHKREANVSFWNDLGLYENGPRHHRPKSVPAPEVPAKKQRDFGKAREKYSLCTNQSSKRVLLLQYPCYGPDFLRRERRMKQPVEVRMKPKSGVIEIDLPVAMNAGYDMEKGAIFAEALSKAKDPQRSVSYGLAGGLGISAKRSFRDNEDVVMGGTRGNGSPDDSENDEKIKPVMNRFTLGGRIVPFQDGDPIYMTAMYEGTICTWTKVDAIVQLRPQFAHLDAMDELNKASARRERGEKPKEELAEDVNMTVKDTADNDSVQLYGGMSATATLLRAMRDEPWQRLSWNNFDNDESIEIRDENMAYQNSLAGPHLISEMTDSQYLDAISCPRIDAMTQGKQVAQLLDNSTQPIPTTSTTDSTSRPPEEPNEDIFSSDTESDVSSSGHIYESLFPKTSQPPGTVEQDIEKICRLISMSPSHLEGIIERQYLERMTGQQAQRFGFLDPTDSFHPYYRWRLERNRRGDGIGPEFDGGTGEEQGQEMRRDV
ncbi:uncharacterized protein KY384_007782 [Bacidia gigantensis]|uniref:uncharacterized protein n=1 Tax=Bacidia gigantensis TaxID=2732470 RepID=UPI001D045D11|nr:uncharacterized protein KY384_007782 [Bacidia gigantensis]KAG8527629.1 hypothetical protein KY384_007782 [Bacidia gigantensis]